MESIIYLLIISIGIITFQGLRDFTFKDKYVFHVDEILISKEYYRLITSGFLHADWLHFGFNMIALSSFGVFCIYEFGISGFATIYVSSLIGGNLLALFVHRDHGDYSALGASGAVYGVVYSTIVYSPFSKLSFVLIPIGFQAWILGVIFIAVSIWGIKKKVGNIGHEAHLGGAIMGMIITAILSPTSVVDNLWIYGLLGLPSLGFVIFIIKNPTYLMVDSASIKPYFSEIRKSKKTERSHQEEIDILLDKINSKGYNSLTNKEKDKLKNLSNKY